MATPDVLDFESHLQPITVDNPSGAELREDRSPLSIYQQIKTARQQARTAERQAMMDDPESPSGIKADWTPILKLAPKAIAEQSKDIELCAWLIEALVRQNGFAGLRDGFRLARHLAENFWDGLHPLPNEDGMINRVASLSGLNGVDGEGSLMSPISKVPLTNGVNAGPFSRSDYKQAADLESITDPDKRNQRISRGAVSMEMFQKSASESSPEFFKELWEDLQHCLDEFEKLCGVLDEKCGIGADGMPAAPPSSAIRASLVECQDVIRSIARHIVEPESQIDTALATTSNGSAITSNGGDGVSMQARIQSRNEAFQALLRVAQFFKDTEPHSPVSYALEQAVRWGRMPLPDLLSELIPDSGSREAVFKLIGIAPPPTSS
jgi:type VI secretion system protein ImpA